MLAEAIKALRDLVSQAESPVAVDIPDPRIRYVAVGGEIQPYELPPPPRNHRVGTLEDLIALALRFVEDGKKPVVWFGAERVVLVIDDDGHRVEQAILVLQSSDVWRVLSGLAEKRPWHDQKGFIRLLRIDFAGTLPPEVLLERIRRVRIEAGHVVSSEVRKDRESMGREINSRVSGEGEIPEDVTLSAPVYQTPGETDRYEVRCSVEIDPGRIDPFRLLPWPDELSRVVDWAMESVRERLSVGLKDSGVPFYFGAP